MRRRTLLRLLGVLAVATGALSTSATPVVATDGVAKLAATGQLKIQRIHTQAGERALPAISGGTVDAAQVALNDAKGDNDEGGAKSGLGFSSGTLGCSDRTSNGNVRVNQDCTYRRQAEEGIAYNPANPSHLLAGQNDSRVGFNQCGIDWSLDNGQHWGDLLPPFRQKLNNPNGQLPTAADPNRHTILGGSGTFHTYDAGSDPMVAFDSQGNAYFGCVGFDIASDASLLYVTRSPKEANGSFFFNLSSFSRRYVVAEDNNPAVFHDKPFLAADFNQGSPNRDNVYVTWTVFRSSVACGAPPNGQLNVCESPIFGSMSTDQGHTFSTPEQISGSSAALCFFGNFFQPSLNPHSCNFDQGSDPVALPNGDLEVIFNNGNTAANNPNAQQLGVHCRPTGKSQNGSAHLHCAAPTKVGDDVIVGEPTCDFGRGPEQCIPGVWIRTNDFPRISRNAQDGHLYATWQDYRNGELDIQLAQSTDGGLTWHQRGTVNPDRGKDHYFPAIDRAPKSDGADRVGASYFRTDRVPNENTGGQQCPGNPTGVLCFAPGQPGVQAESSDYALAGGTAGQTPYAFQVLSPAFGPPTGAQAGFNGDYSGLTINRDEQAHPIWSDTRNQNPFPENNVVGDEDIFTVSVQLPSGGGDGGGDGGGGGGDNNSG